MTEKQKRDAGMPYNPNFDAELGKEMLECKDKCFRYNQISPADLPSREAMMCEILGKTPEHFYIASPFWCDYGYNIEIGENFFANHNLVILDGAQVKFGKNVFLAPDCGFYTAGHPLKVALRNLGIEYARPIVVGDNVWIGAGAKILPGVTIGSNSVIGAGSIVTKDIPEGVLAFGNPCRVQRRLTPEELSLE